MSKVDFQEIISQFRVENEVGPVDRLGTGNINDTWQAGQYVLQRINTAVFKDPVSVMANWEKVAMHLAHQSAYTLRVPVPVTTLAGKSFLQVEDSFWRMLPFFENTYAPEHLPSTTQAFEAASAYGRFLTALQDFPVDDLVEVLPGFHHTEARWSVFEQTIATDAVNRVNTTQTEIAQLYDAKAVFDQITALKRQGALPTRVTHNDTKAGNVLLDAHTHAAVAVIDLDTVMPGTVLSDFGDMVRTFVPDRYEDDPDADALTVRTEVLDALMRGFTTSTAGLLSSVEKEYLPLGGQWIVGEQALRFLNDYLAGDVYYKTAYPTHNLVRARNQLALLRALQRQY